MAFAPSFARPIDLTAFIKSLAVTTGSCRREGPRPTSHGIGAAIFLVGVVCTTVAGFVS
jgi:hypothetical protein